VGRLLGRPAYQLVMLRHEAEADIGGVSALGLFMWSSHNSTIVGPKIRQVKSPEPEKSQKKFAKPLDIGGLLVLQ
jgi:hypothetical protein